MGALKRTAVNLVLIGLYPVYAANLAENIDIKPTVKHIAYNSTEDSIDETPSYPLEYQNFIEFKKNQKLAVRRTGLSYPRLVVVTSPINPASCDHAEFDSSQTGDEEPDNSQGPSDDLINVYAKELLHQNPDVMLSPTLVGFEKW